MPRKLTTEEFIERAKEIHGDKYDYSLVEYGGFEKKVKIICNVHNIFEQTPHAHLSGQNCPICSGKGKITTEIFIERSKKIHGDKYDYSLSVYTNVRTKVKILCKECNQIFEQRAGDHLGGSRCTHCYCPWKNKKIIIKKNRTREDYIIECKKAHGDKYDYSDTVFKYTHLKVKIRCEKHGVFGQILRHHMNGHGCPICAGVAKKDTEQFIKEARVVHGDKYDYSEVEYVDTHTKVKIYCKRHQEYFTKNQILI